MPLEVKRLHLASLRGVDGLEWPVHGFVVTHPRGAVLVDTGVGGPQEWLDDWRVGQPPGAGAPPRAGMNPGGIYLGVNTPPPFPPFGPEAVFPPCAFFPPRAGLL